MDIKVTSIRFLTGNRSLKAFADIQIGDMGVREFRIIQEPGRRAWIASPQVSWKDTATGQLMYKTLIVLPDELKGEINRIILNAYVEQREKNRNET